MYTKYLGYGKRRKEEETKTSEETGAGEEAGIDMTIVDKPDIFVVTGLTPYY